ncbi:MAG: GerMN domain-containing protein [Desulfuromonadales bacterium]
MRLWVFLLLILPLLAACERREAENPAQRIEATEAYRTYFGPPPIVREGSCFALVGFLPLDGNPGQVKPLPFFLFVEEPSRQMRLLIEHLLQLPEHVLPPGLIAPFPAGATLETLTVRGEVAEVNLSFPGEAPTDPQIIQGIASALGHSLVQFPGILRVRISAGNSLLPHLPPEGFLPDPADVFQPEPPRPIGIAGVWENGSGPEEVMLFFDRPVEVRSVQLTSEGGKPLDGDYFQSAFDMAVVVRPAAPASLAEGMPITVDFAVADSLERAASGRETFPLSRIEHP